MTVIFEEKKICKYCNNSGIIEYPIIEHNTFYTKCALCDCEMGIGIREEELLSGKKYITMFYTEKFPDASLPTFDEQQMVIQKLFESYQKNILPKKIKEREEALKNADR